MRCAPTSSESMANSSDVQHSRGVSFVLPVHNGAEFIEDALRSVLAQSDGRPFEVIVVEDHSTDSSRAVLDALAREWSFEVLPAERRGLTAALNQGIRAARYPIICQVDQDVILEPGWMQHLVSGLDDHAVAAVQGVYL